MAVELYIEDKPVDLTGVDNIVIEYSVAPIGDISKRTGAGSYQFNLLKTAKNRAIFENPDDINSISLKPYTKLKARLYGDGVDLKISFAYLESTKDVYSVRIYGENSDIFERMKALKLQGLSFCQYDHFWNFATVKDSRNNTDGYVYPIIDNYDDSPNSRIDNVAREIDCRNLLPAVYVHSVLEAIESYFGITIDNRLESIPNHPSTSLIVPFSRGSYKKTRNPERYEVLFECATDIELDTPLSGLHPGFITGVILEFDDRVGCSDYWNKVDVYAPTEIQFAEKVRATVDYTIILEADPLTPGPYDTLILLTPAGSKVLAGTGVAGVDFVEIPVTIPASGSVTFTGSYTFTTSNTELYKNGLIMAVIVPPDTVILKQGSKARIKDITVLEDAEISYSISSVIDNFVTVASALPDWSCMDFIKEYCLMFGALLSYNQTTNTLSIIPFSEIKNNVSRCLNWSDKLDFTEEPEITTRLDDYGQVNRFMYAEDGDVIKPEGTDTELVINDETLEAEYTAVELKYGATETVERLIGVTIPQIKIFGNDGANLSGAGTQRILALKVTDTSDYGDTSDITYVDGTSTSVGITNIVSGYFIDSAEAFNLGFANNIFDTYYTAFAEVLENAKRIRCQLKLNAADINQLDFTRPVYIKHFNAYFYISNIEDYSPTTKQSTMVELVKLF